ncbi:MAG: glutamate--cysteine ligase [Pseudomonadota bacterium]
MYHKLNQRIKKLLKISPQDLFGNNLIGLEKESLRVNSQGSLTQTLHPIALGSSLTHPYITTDYSEALLELITPPLNNIAEVIRFLQHAHKFVYQNLDNESLWATSMPCILAGETSIPLAKYGTSNAGQMKNIYRNGLGLRYGREMQVIAGVHFNFSLAPEFWEHYYDIENTTTEQQHPGSLTDFISDNYFHLIRNLQRMGWLVPYLFGASPAVCKSFLGNKATHLEEFDASTYYEPYATSLRMGDIGYQNNKENESGIKAIYDNVETYVDSLSYAINTTCPEYQKLGIKKDRIYQQLNANILQIENEYYSTIRPKQILNDNESPSFALKNRGVRYVELRSLDVNAYDPLGINKSQLFFLEAFLIFCLLHDSPIIDKIERKEIDENEMQVAHAGRKPGLELQQKGEIVTLKQWGLEICDEMLSICEILDKKSSTRCYTESLHTQRNKIRDASLTPSARMLEEMRENNESFHHFAARKSKLHQHYFKQVVLSQQQQLFFKQQAHQSIKKQLQLEANDKLSLDNYLEQYFSQK